MSVKKEIKAAAHSSSAAPAWSRSTTPPAPRAGDVYVGEFESRSVRKYNENGVLQTGWANGGVLTGAGSANNGAFEQAPGGITVDSAGDLRRPLHAERIGGRQSHPLQTGRHPDRRPDQAL